MHEVLPQSDPGVDAQKRFPISRFTDQPHDDVTEEAIRLTASGYQLT